uniref:Uncharacterized protein n=1 Tax=Colobus angolensis palliatus TaxID=336983 RepID=A0A2K5J8W2_COLAP
FVSHSSWEAGPWAPWQPGSALRSQLRCQCLGLPCRLCGGVGWAPPFTSSWSLGAGPPVEPGSWQTSSMSDVETRPSWIKVGPGPVTGDHLRERGGGSEIHRWGTSRERTGWKRVCAGGGCAGSSPEPLETACPGHFNVGLLAAELRGSNSLAAVSHPGCGNLLWPPYDASSPPSLMSGAKAGKVKYLGLKALGFLR